MLGSFESGRLFSCPDDDGVEDVRSIGDERMMVLPADDFAIFDGYLAHFVEDFVGERFSIIYFTPSTWESADEVACDFLVNWGAWKAV